MTLPPRVAAFLRNDLEHAPFGIGALRGLTPARMALAAAACLAIALVGAQTAFAAFGLNERVFNDTMRQWMRVFLSALPLVLLINTADRMTAASSSMRRICAFAIATLLGAAAFTAILSMAIPALFSARPMSWSQPLVAVRFYQATLTGALFSAIPVFAAREREAGKQLLRSRLARVAAERQMAEARLQLLRAQIEPHFLFNSLASVKVLCESDVAGGRHLLRNMGTTCAPPWRAPPATSRRSGTRWR